MAKVNYIMWVHVIRHDRGADPLQCPTGKSVTMTMDFLKLAKHVVRAKG